MIILVRNSVKLLTVCYVTINMPLKFAFTLFFVTLCGTVCGENDLTKAPRFALNLDLPEADRWTPILKHWDIEVYQKLVRDAIRYMLYI